MLVFFVLSNYLLYKIFSYEKSEPARIRYKITTIKTKYTTLIRLRWTIFK
jgi:hypothetical protein